ncbi:MAG: radical SAM protein, partial [Elusimicrobiales bacterium]|nr:radical SAM protein [Elusimicrobiales bacterium]
MKQRPEPNVFLTSRCNGHCIYCSAKGEDRGMTPEQAEEVISAGYKALVFEGGEPLLCRDLETWIKKAVSLGVEDISILTNGYLLTEDRLKSLLDA